MSDSFFSIGTQMKLGKNNHS